LQALLVQIIASPEVYKKIIGMQLLVEGLAMGAFAAHYVHNRDPLARKLFQLVMTDEAFHHKFGKIWADRTIPKLSKDELNVIEDWAAHCFQSLLFNLGNPIQMGAIYRQFGMEPQLVLEAMQKLATSEFQRERMRAGTNIFRVLVKTLLKAGLITERTRAFYAVYVDLDELKAEGDRMIGDDIAEDGIKFLQTVNFNTRPDVLTRVAAE
jgi:hypothetical protein